MKRTSSDHGFTLVELLVVMSIVSVLTAIAIPSFGAQRGKAHDTAAKSDLRSAAMEAESYFAEHSSYPTAWVAGDRPATPAPGTGYYRRSETVSLIQTVTSPTWYCLQVTAGSGRVLSYDSSGGLQPTGTSCPGL